MDEQQQNLPPAPPEPPASAPAADPDRAQQATDDKLSRNLLIGGLLIVALALGVHLMSPKEPVGGQPAGAARTGTDSGAPVEPKAVPSVRGKDAPDVALKNLEGKPIALKELRGKAVLVNFWATWCGPCLIEMPWFVEFKEKYGQDGFEVYAISLDEEGPGVVKPFVEKHKMQSLTIVMGEEKTPEAFGGLLGLPTSFMVDREGKLYSKHQGLVQKDDIEEEIQILLGKPMARSLTDAPAAERP